MTIDTQTTINGTTYDVSIQTTLEVADGQLWHRPDVVDVSYVMDADITRRRRDVPESVFQEVEDQLDRGEFDGQLEGVAISLHEYGGHDG